jgi:hypothetical protein
MDAPPPLVMSFSSLDDAESALDWIGVDFVERASAFEGVLADDDRDLLAAAIDDPDSPGPVRDLARVLTRLLDEQRGGSPAWRVGFGA